MTSLQPLIQWTTPFAEFYRNALVRYANGTRSPQELLQTAEEASLLARLGISPQNLYDYVEDGINLETVLLVFSLRRDYFWLVQEGIPSPKRIPEAEFPRKTDAFEHIPWLPRIVLKAQSFLKGELPETIMFGCRGDRDFCREHRINLAEFLHFVWLAGDDALPKAVAWFRLRKSQSPAPQS